LDESGSDRSASKLTRRDLLKVGALGTVGLAAGGSALALQSPYPVSASQPGHGSHHDMVTVGEIRRSSFDPSAFLTQFERGRETHLASGQKLCEFDIEATETELEVAPGVFFPAWAYNGQVPGPTIRCTEGDRVRVRFTNSGKHPHTMHFHGFHAANMDGAFEVVNPGRSYTYEFDARPFGVQLYHCHTVPLKRHLHKGLYGMFIIDPREGRPPAQEMVMVMNAFDTNFDGENEIYAVNSVAFHYQKHPINIRQGELVRIYLANFTEFDLINSLHLHGGFFKLFRTGTNLQHHEWTDVVMLCQGERAVLEFTYDFAGPFMFHAHQSEFAELGWTGLFLVRGENDRSAA
jgi:manganese oxidase